MRELILYFTIYSFLGWLSETIYCFIIDKKFTYRGFLYGPVCPIYGFGAIIVLSALDGLKDNVLFVFLGGMILASILEYITSYILEKLFNMKWWDYSKHKFNINGRVCLLNSTFFGLLSVFIIEVLQPSIKDILTSLSSSIVYSLSGIISIIFIIDLIFTVTHLLHLKEHLVKVKDIKVELNKLGIQLEKFSESEINKLKIEIQNRRTNKEYDKLLDLSNRIKELKREAKINRRLLNAFPNSKHLYDYKGLNNIKNLIKK